MATTPNNFDLLSEAINLLNRLKCAALQQRPHHVQQTISEKRSTTWRCRTSLQSRLRNETGGYSLFHQITILNSTLGATLHVAPTLHKQLYTSKQKSNAMKTKQAPTPDNHRRNVQKLPHRNAIEIQIVPAQLRTSTVPRPSTDTFFSFLFTTQPKKFCCNPKFFVKWFTISLFFRIFAFPNPYKHTKNVTLYLQKICIENTYLTNIQYLKHIKC